MISFEDYLCNRNDAIDNAAYQLICAMTAQDHNEPKEDDPAVPDWNMEIIGELVDAAEEIIQEKAGHLSPILLRQYSLLSDWRLQKSVLRFLTDWPKGGRHVKKPVDFDWYCKTKKDVINNAAYELIVALTAKSAPPRKFELSIPQRDDEMIANVVEGAINAVEAQIGYYCHPFYQEADMLPCYLGDLCDNPHCIFKSNPDYRKAPPSVMDMSEEEGGDDDG